MRFLGIDYGTKRIGLATSDEDGVLAFPKCIVLNDSKALERIGDIIEEDKIEEIVIGDSLDFSGKPNVLAEEIDRLIVSLTERFFLPIHKQQEFLTSVEARKAGKTKASLQKSDSHSKIKKKIEGKVDARAAALILQRFLEQNNK